jgi:hypothetical protein
MRIDQDAREEVCARVPEGAAEIDPVLTRLDGLLDDDALDQQVRTDFGKRSWFTLRQGRHSTPVDVLLRMLSLKQLSQWSDKEWEGRVKDSVVLRWFCRVGFHGVPDASTLWRWQQDAATRDGACAQRPRGGVGQAGPRDQQTHDAPRRHLRADDHPSPDRLRAARGPCARAQPAGHAGQGDAAGSGEPHRAPVPLTPRDRSARGSDLAPAPALLWGGHGSRAEVAVPDAGRDHRARTRHRSGGAPPGALCASAWPGGRRPGRAVRRDRGATAGRRRQARGHSCGWHALRGVSGCGALAPLAQRLSVARGHPWPHRQPAPGFWMAQTCLSGARRDGTVAGSGGESQQSAPHRLGHHRINPTGEGGACPPREKLSSFG